MRIYVLILEFIGLTDEVRNMSSFECVHFLTITSESTRRFLGDSSKTIEPKLVCFQRIFMPQCCPRCHPWHQSSRRVEKWTFSFGSLFVSP